MYLWVLSLVLGLLSCSDSINTSDLAETSSEREQVSSNILKTSSAISRSSGILSSSSQQAYLSSSNIDFSVLLLNFPQGQVKPDSSLKINWTIEGSLDSSFAVFLDLKYLGGSFEVYKTWTSVDSIQFDLKHITNGSRVQLRLRIASAGIEKSDQTQFFDVHSGITRFRYTQDAKPLFSKYCTECHGTEGGLHLETYSTITQGNTPLYLMNRVNFIRDMPPKSHHVKPTDQEREILRDWILGGFPL